MKGCQPSTYNFGHHFQKDFYKTFINNGVCSIYLCQRHVDLCSKRKMSERKHLICSSSFPFPPLLQWTVPFRITVGGVITGVFNVE